MALFIRQGDKTLIGARVKAAVADKMEDVPGAAPHSFLQIPPGLARQPGQIQEPLLLQVLDGVFNALSLPVYVQRGRSVGLAIMPRRRSGGVTVRIGMGWGNSRYRMVGVFFDRQRYSPRRWS